MTERGCSGYEQKYYGDGGGRGRSKTAWVQIHIPSLSGKSPTCLAFAFICEEGRVRTLPRETVRTGCPAHAVRPTQLARARQGLVW